MNPRVDVFIDIVCPWCLIGARRLEEALAGTDGAVVRYHPFLLDPSTPPEGEDLAERLRRKYGGDPRLMQARVEQVARAGGIPLDFTKVKRSYPTVAAHTLLRHAPDQRALANALFEAYFLEGRNIADPETLVEIATGRGEGAGEARRLITDESELAVTRQLARQASDAGINGVPFFIFGGRLAVSGAQPVEVLRQAMQQAAEPEAEGARE